MKTKEIKKIINESHVHMVGDGFRVSQYIPGSQHLISEVSPFLMLDYNAPYHFPPSQHRKGVGAHPHKGFETVTIVYEGKLEHRDSSGGGGVIGPGDVQWMTAGNGIVHDEFQTDEISKHGGTQHVIQLWVNLPAKDKSTPPTYQNLTAENIGVYQVDSSGSIVRVIAGNYSGIKGPAKTFTPINMYDIRLKKGSEIELPVPLNHNSMFLTTQGHVMVNDTQEAVFRDFVLFKTEGENIKIKAQEDSMILFMSGESINEPIARYGPFVMNTQQELIQAFEDYNAGKFGILV